MRKFKELSDWIDLDHCATRIVVGGDVNNVADRVAFIEKTPRVRVSRYGVESDHHCGVSHPGKDAWVHGFKDTDGKSEKSRQWCDDMLALLGWE